jgi:hypothetical protein
MECLFHQEHREVFFHRVSMMLQQLEHMKRVWYQCESVLEVGYKEIIQKKVVVEDVWELHILVQ